MTTESIRMQRVSAIVRNLKSEDEMLNAIRPIMYAPDLMDFGTPDAAEERRQARREKLYRRCFRIGMVVVLLIIGFYVGRNV